MKRACDIFINDQQTFQGTLVDAFSVNQGLSLQDCSTLARVGKQWDAVFTKKLDESLWNMCVFDEEKWKTKVPGVTSVSCYKIDPVKKTALIAQLKLKCNFWNNNGFWQTRLVILLPKKINEQPVNIKLIGQIFSFVKDQVFDPNDRFWAINAGTAFSYLVDAHSSYWDPALERTCFLMATLYAIPGSSGKVTHEEKEGLLKPDYRAPSPLEATISELVMNIGQSQKNEGYFFGKGYGKTAFTATNVLYQGGRMVVGENSSKGIKVWNEYHDEDWIGMMAVKEVDLEKIDEAEILL